MAIQWIRPIRAVKKVKSIDSQEVLRRLQIFLESDQVIETPVRILARFWEDQQNVLGYQELRQIIQDEIISQQALQLWSQDYSVLVANQFYSVWMDAVKAGAAAVAEQPLFHGIPFDFQIQTPGLLHWIQQRGAEFVTACTIEQKQAIATLLTKKMKERHTVDELSRMIRPCIGLTKEQVKANIRYYENIVENLKKEHPKMKLESIQKKAQAAAQKYAERQHRQRAITIAQTESAFAYHHGADEGIRQAQAKNLLGKVKKCWCTSGDDAVCEICASLDGIELEMDVDFKIKGKSLFKGQHRLPPAHPRCACAVEYIEEEMPIYPNMIFPETQISITEKNSLKEYSIEEIENIAIQTEKIASKYINVPSAWSGKIVVDDEFGRIGKDWNCDILTTRETAPHMILHEQIHARSISYYDQGTYKKYRSIEEATVQFMTQEISKKEKIEIIESQYDEIVNALREIGRHIGAYKTDYDFAKVMIEMPVSERLNWLSNSLYGTMSINQNLTIEDYMKLSELLDMLY